jgi:hypothetical protein
MGIFGGSKSSTTSNLYDQKVGASEGSIVAQTGSNVIVTDAQAVPTLGAVAVEVARSAERSSIAQAQAAAASARAAADAAQRSLTSGLQFGAEVLDEGFDFGGRALDYSNDAFLEAYRFGDEAFDFTQQGMDEIFSTIAGVLGLVNDQQDKNIATTEQTIALASNSINKVAESTKSEGERVIKLFIMAVAGVAGLWAIRGVFGK